MSANNPEKAKNAGKTLMLVCEGVRAELEQAIADWPDKPEIVYMPQGLHDEPDKMRSELNAKIAELEASYPEVDTLLLGYGLCGRGMNGVTASRFKLVVPRVHDCVPLYVGVAQDELGMTEENSGILWLAASMIEYSRFTKHLVTDRHKIYAEKFGEARAAKMIKAENSVFANYRGLWYVRWPGLKDEYADMARKLASELSLPYKEITGDSAFLGDLAAGGEDEERFLHLEPGWTVGMDSDGKIIGQQMASGN